MAILAALSVPPIPAQAAYHLTAKIEVGGEGGWDYLEPDPIARRLYVSHEDHVVVIDMDALKVVGDVPDTPGIGGVALARDLDRGFTANGDEDTVGVFELGSLRPLAKWKATGKRPNQIAYEPTTQRVFSFNSTGRNVTVFDARSGAVLGTIEVDGRTEFYALDGKGMIYDSLQDKATVIAIDARAMKVVATYPLAPHAQPAGTVMDPLTRRIFVACRSKSFLVLDADSGKILATFPIGERNDAAKFDPGLKLAFASNGDGTVAVVHEESADKFTLVETVHTEYGARTMAVDPTTHRLFLPSADFAPAAAPTPANPNPRRTMVPGSLRVLVFEP
ncbi:MAG TPA: YncE family protein [Gammaproteobacteria bacterium]|nr:YncE family protein [Gammaproteobacteria bacterium]